MYLPFGNFNKSINQSVLYWLIPSPFNKLLQNTQSTGSTARLSPYLGGICLEINLIQGGLPNRIVIGMVDADAFNGTYTKNPFNFKNYDITTMGLTVNGENLPVKPLQLKFGADSNYISAFQTLYAGEWNQLLTYVSCVAVLVFFTRKV
jgi:hypothetical protein